MRVKLLGLIMLGLVVALSASSAHAQAPAVRIIAKFPAYIGWIARSAESIEAEIASTRSLARELSDSKVARDLLSKDDYLSIQRKLNRLTPLSKDELDRLGPLLSTDSLGNVVLRRPSIDDYKALRDATSASKAFEKSTAEVLAKSDAPKIKFSLDGKLKIGTLKTFGNNVEIEGGEYNLYMLGAGVGAAGFCGTTECYKGAARFIIDEAVKAKEVREMADRIEKAKKPLVVADPAPG